MKTGLGLISALLVTAAFSTTAFSDGHSDNKAIEAAIKARQSQMRLYAFNIGLLGGMAKGEIDYDADAAQAAASNLAALAKLDQSRLWPKGSDSETLGKDKPEALAAIWVPGSEVGAKAMAMTEAAVAMDAAAGGGLDSLRGAIGPLGKSCGGCHETFRVD